MDREINVRYILDTRYIVLRLTRDNKVTGAIFPIFPLRFDAFMILSDVITILTSFLTDGFFVDRH